MRGMIVIAMIVAVTMVVAGIIASQIGGSSSSGTPVGIVATTTTTTSDNPAQTTSGTDNQTPADQPGQPTSDSTTGQQSDGGEPQPTGPGSNEFEGQPIENVLPANPPVRAAPINGVQAVDEYYSESYQIGNFIIAWRPGAFPPERAEQIAAQAQESLDYVNQQLGTSDNGVIEILLADQMYLKEDCHGCQGYAFSDFRQVFILQDGSMADEEFKALLTHEIGHVIAGNHFALPHVATLFMAEGLSTWLMTRDLVAEGFIEPRQIAAWAWKVGLVPSIWDLRKAKFEGRTGARVEYDPAGSFTQFMMETYGLEVYKQIYAAELPDDVIGKSWEDLEREWHNWLATWADNTVNGVDAHAWWNMSAIVTQGFERLYEDETTVTQEQYALLATARVALNRGDLDTAMQLMQASGLTSGTAN